MAGGSMSEAERIPKVKESSALLKTCNIFSNE